MDSMLADVILFNKSTAMQRGLYSTTIFFITVVKMLLLCRVAEPPPPHKAKRKVRKLLRSLASVSLWGAGTATLRLTHTWPIINISLFSSELGMPLVQHVARNNIASFYVEMRRAFGRALRVSQWVRVTLQRRTSPDFHPILLEVFCFGVSSP